MDVNVSNLINYFSANLLLQIKTYCNFQRLLLNKWGKMSKGGTAASLMPEDGRWWCWRLQAAQPTDNVRRMALWLLVVVASCNWYNTTHACMPTATKHIFVASKYFIEVYWFMCTCRYTKEALIVNFGTVSVTYLQKSAHIKIWSHILKFDRCLVLVGELGFRIHISGYVPFYNCK